MIPLYHNTRTKMLENCAKNVQMENEQSEQKTIKNLYIKHFRNLNCSNKKMQKILYKKFIVDKNTNIGI